MFRRIAHRVVDSRGGGGEFAIGDRQVFKLSIGDAARFEDDYLFEGPLPKAMCCLVMTTSTGAPPALVTEVPSSRLVGTMFASILRTTGPNRRLTRGVFNAPRPFGTRSNAVIW